MNSPLSLVQELRGIRGGPNKMQSDVEGLLLQIEEARREWQTEIDQAQQIFRDLLTTISELSGVDLPTIALDDQRSGNASLRIGFKTLKDRIRNDLEGFSVTAALELGKRAHEKSQTVLEPLEKEMAERLDHLAEEFKAKALQRLAAGQEELAQSARVQIDQVLQTKMDEFAGWIKLMGEGAVASVPEKVERAVEPHVKEVSDRLKASFEQQLHYILHDQEKASRDRAREMQQELQAQVTKIAEDARHSSEQVAETAVKSFSERLVAVADEATTGFDTKIEGGVERTLDHFRQRLGELSNSTEEGLRGFAAQQSQALCQQLQKTAEEMQGKAATGISDNIDKITREALEASLQHLRGQLDVALESSKDELRASLEDLMKSVRQQMSDLGQSAHESLSQDVANLAASLQKLGEELKAAGEERVMSTKGNLTALAQGALETVAANMKLMVDKQVGDVRAALQDFQHKLAAEHAQAYRETMAAQQNDAIARVQQKTEEAAGHAVAQIKTSSDQIVKGLSEKVNKEVNTATSLLKDWANQTTAWAESTIKNSFESYQREITRLTESVLENHRTTINGSIGDLQGRLEQAAALLRGLNGHHPAGPNAEPV